MGCQINYFFAEIKGLLYRGLGWPAGMVKNKIKFRIKTHYSFLTDNEQMLAMSNSGRNRSFECAGDLRVQVYITIGWLSWYLKSTDALADEAKRYFKIEVLQMKHTVNMRVSSTHFFFQPSDVNELCI